MRFIELNKTLEQYGDLLVKEYKKALARDKTDASGDLIESLTYEVNESDMEAKMSVLALEYMGAISGGIRNKRTADSDNILKWMEVKGIRPRKGGTSESNMKRTAFAIARSIGHHGIIERFGYSGSKVIDYVFKDIAPLLSRDLTIAFGNDVERIFKESLNTE